MSGPTLRHAPDGKSVAILGTRGYPSYYGGFETAVRFLAPYLADHGWQVTVYVRPDPTFKGEVADPRIQRQRTLGLETKSLSTLTYGLSSAAHASTFVRPSVALVMNVANGFWLPLLHRQGIPSVVNVDGIEWERDKWSRMAQRVFYLGARATARWATELICDSRVIREEWANSFNRNGHFVPYGGKPATTETPTPLGLPRRGYALLVARFVPENSVPEFFLAARDIASKHPVVIVGSSGYGGSLELAARDLAQAPNVHWLGHVRDDSLLHALWQNAGAYFHGHTVGGTNPALVQAMALGAPTVAVDTRFNREVLGEGGIFVSPHPERISTAIQSLLSDPRAMVKHSRAAQERARALYSWDGVCGAYETVLTSVL